MTHIRKVDISTNDRATDELRRACRRKENSLPDSDI
jgi:hypothetical protein